MANLAMLASDDNNPEFQGARNPDDLLYKRFYIRPCYNEFESLKQSRPVYDDVIYVEITTPGNLLNIIDRPKNYGDERRFPREWAFFKNNNSDEPAKQGTPLSQWPILTPAMCEMLRALKFYTVEQIALASDEQIGHIGMTAGMQPMAFRERAKTYLSVARNASAATEQQEELKKRDAEIAELKAKDAQRNEQFQLMQAQLSALVKPKGKPGRKPKVKEEGATL